MRITHRETVHLEEAQDKGSGSGSSGSGGAVGGALITLAVDSGPLGNFDISGDPSTVSQRWKRWVRGFKLYITGRGITSDAQKQALLLHTAGLEVQDIFYSPVGEDTVKTYEQTMVDLDNHFTPKSNIPFERHQFRQTTQGETIDKWVCRLRQKAANCDFGKSADDQIRDHVIDKCLSNQLRRKFWERDSLKLPDLLKLARAHEAVDRQVKVMEGSGQVNALSRKAPGMKPQSSFSKKKECYACGQEGHFARDRKCPAEMRNLR